MAEQGNVAQTDASKEAKAVKVGKAKEPMHKIILENGDDIPASGLPVGVNGKAYLIPTGVEVEVPASVLGVLKNAVISVPEIDRRTQKIIGYRNKMKYPYQVVA